MKTLRHLLLHGLIAHAVLGSEVGASLADARGRGQAAPLPGTTEPSAQIPLRTAEGFAVPQPGEVFSFPRDHGSHPAFKLEWWYLTGHLYT